MDELVTCSTCDHCDPKDTKGYKWHCDWYGTYEDPDMPRECPHHRD